MLRRIHLHERTRLIYYRKIVLDLATRTIFYKATDVNGYLAISIGAGTTVIVEPPCQLVSDRTAALHVALACFLFQCCWYRHLCAEFHSLRCSQLGKAAILWGGFPIVYYIAVIFLSFPLCFWVCRPFRPIMVAILTVMIGIALLYLGYWCKLQVGNKICHDCFVQLEHRRIVRRDLPDDMDGANEIDKGSR